MIDARGRVGFQVSGTPEILPESSLRALIDETREPKPAAGTPPFQVNLSPWGRISGRQADLSGREIRLDPGQGGARIKIAPGGASSIVQRPGEWQVLHDGFEALDVTRWSQGGSPVVSAEPHLAGARALRLPAGGASITTRLAEGIGSGRLEVAFFDDGGKVAGHRCRRGRVHRWSPQPRSIVFG